MSWSSSRGARVALVCMGFLGLLIANCGTKSSPKRRDPSSSGANAGEDRVVDAGTLPPGDGGPDPYGPGGADAAPAEVGIDTRPSNARCVAPERPTLASSVALEPVFAGLVLDRPLGLYQAPGDAAHFYVIEQSGKVRRFANQRTTTQADTVLEVGVVFGGSNDERGLLGLAFHPDFARNRYAYVNFVDDANGLQSHVDRYRVSADGKTFSERKRIFSVAQPYSNHNGGNLLFGPDGYLYLGFGDGGAANDPEQRAQNLDSLLGKMLRIDVDHGDPYAIPESNPFANGGGKPEIFAYGLRNPWRYSFDRDTGDLWVGDVGQNCFEEVSIVKRGENHGWNPHLQLFDRALPESPALPEVHDDSLPVAERARAYLHGNCAYCHRPGGPGRGPLDLRFDASSAQACNVAPQEGDLGLAGAKLLVPGNADLSLIYRRMHTRKDGAMPPLATTKVDSKGAALLKRWITEQSACTP